MEDAVGPQPNDGFRFKRVLEAGADIVGGASGVMAGLAIAGPPGAFAGAAAGPAVASVMKDVIDRVLSRREEKRVGGVFIAASAAYEELLALGATLRSDGFFEAGEETEVRRKRSLKACSWRLKRHTKNGRFPIWAT